MLSRAYLRDVPLPEDLTKEQILEALESTQDFFRLIRTSSGIILSEIIQANNFSELYLMSSLKSLMMLVLISHTMTKDILTLCTKQEILALKLRLQTNL